MPERHVKLASHGVADPSCGHDSAIMCPDGLGLLTDANTRRQGLMQSWPSYFKSTLKTHMLGQKYDGEQRRRSVGVFDPGLDRGSSIIVL